LINTVLHHFDASIYYFLYLNNATRVCLSFLQTDLLVKKTIIAHFRDNS